MKGKRIVVAAVSALLLALAFVGFKAHLSPGHAGFDRALGLALASHGLADGGALRFEVKSTEVEAFRGRRKAHVHLAVSVAGDPLDFCLLGVGQDDQAALDQAASVFAQAGLDPVLGSLGLSAASAVPFSGTQAWGVAGRRGYLGDVISRGVPVGDYSKVPLFEGAVGLPADGRRHLLKAVAVGADGAWTCTLELDGAPLLEDRPVSVPLPGPAGMLVRYAVFREEDRWSDSSARGAALTELREAPAWLTRAEVCPLDVLPSSFSHGSFDEEGCHGGRLSDCVRECRSGVGQSCYSAALDLQGAKETDLAQSLFLEGCRHGYASACTNGAAGRSSGKPSDECAAKTFDLVCQRAQDPWACTMLGLTLVRGSGLVRDLDRARWALARACADDPADPACTAANSIAAQLAATELDSGR